MTRRPRHHRAIAAPLAILWSALILATSTVTASASSLAPRSETAADPAALSSGQLQLDRVTGGLNSPLGITHAGDGSGRLFVVERGGKVRVIKSRKLQSGVFLDVGNRIVAGGEQGLLGLAFHPNFASNGYVYVYYTRSSDGDIIVARLTANAAKTFASNTSLVEILRIEHSSHSNHNGGAMAFGPDGFLYLGVGDGGGAGDPGENGQDKNTTLGKILRINVNGTGSGPYNRYSIPADNPFVGGIAGLDEIWAIGVRNPWRITFDRANGNLFIADVGQSRWEEVNREPSTSAGGRNYGWDQMEGTSCYEPSTGCSTSGKILPTAQYSHSLGCSITGGYVYRGATQRDLQGLYTFADYCTGRIWTMPATGSGITQRRDTSLNISSFGESETGELYLTDLNGAVYRVIAPEFSDIASSTFLDSIHWMFYEGITGGCGGTKFCPRSNVTRVQMAQFLVRGFNYPPTSTDYFTDDEGITGESSINALAKAGITTGCTATRFCPTNNVTREQMAIFLDRALDLPATSVDYYTDDEGRTGEAAINRLAKSGITGGCATNRYCPGSPVTREQMAAFLNRALAD